MGPSLALLRTSDPIHKGTVEAGDVTQLVGCLCTVLNKLDMVVVAYAYNSSTQVIKNGRSEV